MTETAVVAVSAPPLAATRSVRFSAQATARRTWMSLQGAALTFIAKK
jgi:hypothetical protein